MFLSQQIHTLTPCFSGFNVIKNSWNFVKVQILNQKGWGGS